ncbi:glycosyl transferase [Methanocella arvoryzae]|uniref:Glycosyltransferase subfamily 4-like N-terminal domain-containing protein n=1 Tax=Methanocella arvoryzae (strain DSM 22066 / NBRC 105507 / MRE50) TaxID=351160 RepID=Q0W4G7_METAR|nr:glycosyl transferase [Methanocella arvoryzae]CAJ36726.1 hypothetical protein RCIA113 [Methanocella arvoryzae MRE50]
MDRKKILIVTQQYPPEANAFRISDMVKYLSDNLDVTILSPHPTIPIGTFKRKWKVSESVVINSIKVVNLWTWQPKSSDPGFLSRMSYYLLFSLHATIWSLINSKKFDLILTSTPPIFVNLPGLICKQLLKKPWIVDVRDLWIDAAIGLGFLKEGSINEKMSRKFEKVCYEKSDKICVTTNVIEEKIWLFSIFRMRVSGRLLIF